MFKVGDYVQGTDRKTKSIFSQTNSNLLKAKVTEVSEYNGMMMIEILESKIRNSVGHKFRVEMKYFDKYKGSLIKGLEVVSTDKRALKVEDIGKKNIITINNSIFISIPSGSNVGIASKHDDDEFNEEIGKALAYFRYTNNKEM